MSSSGEAALKHQSQPAAWVLFARSTVQYLFAPTRGLLPQCFTARQCINLHKILVLPIYIIILYAHGGDDPFDFASKSYGPAALALLVCHSLYGIMWVYKDVHFGDPSWLVPMCPLGFVLVFTYPLALYYLPMLCLVSEQECPGGTFGSGSESWIVGGGLFFYTIGMFYHFGSDCQKYYCLKYQHPRSLITDGFFSHCRNPNYFGEIMIYIGYGLWSCSYIVIPLFSTVWIFIFLPNMLAKEASMSRYPQWQAWHDRTSLVCPWLPSLLKDLYVKGMGSGRDKKKQT